MATYIDPRVFRPVTERVVGEALEAINEGGGTTLPIEISDVTGLQPALDSKGTSNLQLGTTATTAMAGNATPTPADNSVTNAKVAANAAIALTKLANVAAGTGGLTAGTLQATLQALATRIQALEDAAGE